MSNDTQTLIPEINRTVAAIGQRLASTGPSSDHGTTGTRPLKFGKKSTDQWASREPDLLGVIEAARRTLFGPAHHVLRVEGVANSPAYSAGVGGHVAEGDESVAPQHFDGRHFRVLHPFWSTFEPSDDTSDDWALLAGHMQRIYTELVTTVLAGADHRPAVLKLIGMEDAVDAVHRAKMASLSRREPWRYKREYLVMQNWLHASDRRARTKQIREFLENSTTVPCSVKPNPSDENRWTIKPNGRPAIEFHAPDYLAIDRRSGDPVVFESEELRRH